MWFSTIHTFVLFSLLSALLTEAEYTDDYRYMSHFLAEKSIQPQTNVRYAFRELWPAKEWYEKCWGDFSHVRLVVGEFIYTPGRMLKSGPIEEVWDFRAHSWEIFKDPRETLAEKAYGSPIHSKEDRRWTAYGLWDKGHHYSYPNNRYEVLGAISSGATDTFIRSLAGQYVREHEVYNLATVNCYKYVEWLLHQIRQVA